MIPPGLTATEIAGRVEDAGLARAQDVLDAMIDLADEYPVMKNPEGLQGYMFPDTYLIPRFATASAVANIFYRNFEKKFDRSLRNEAEKKGLDVRKVVILASIVEREAKYKKDKPIVAGILLRRLKKDWPLQADATVQYALGYQPKERSWWKESLTKEDLKIDSPYNTYKKVGLPPTPICNPGLLSIKAVIYPEKTDYWYYLSDKEGKMHYAETFEEHNQNIQEYLR